MSPEMQAAMVAAGAGVMGSIITVVGPNLTSRYVGTGGNRDLRGKWVCEWDVLEPDGDPAHIEDVVTVKRVHGDTIHAHGVNPGAGGYVLMGRVSQAGLVTLYYSGEEERRTLGGVVIMELSPTRDEMHGRWQEYNRERVFRGGTTRWRRRPESR